MDNGQFIRQLGRGLRAGASALLAWLGKMFARAAGGRADPFSHFLVLPGAWRAIALLALALIVIYPLSAWWLSVIDDNPDFGVAAKARQSSAIASMAALLNREVNINGWTPNDTFLSPTSLLDNMPNYQRGILASLAHVSLVLNDRMGRAPGAPTDADLQEATSDLQTAPDAWSLWNDGAEHAYNDGIAALGRYNSRLAAGTTIFNTRADNLAAVLAAMADDLDVQGASIDAHLARDTNFFISNKADDVFYAAKGEAYADYVVLKGLERDFAGVIRQRQLQSHWQAMMGALRGAVALRPWVVMNGAPDSLLVPCPLCGEGFFILRARSEMQAVADGLGK